MEQAARIANHAAGIVVGKLGVAVATPEELRSQLSPEEMSRGPRTRSMAPPKRPLSARR
jgi:bifunctional ADP-heptose synthase (sugar kinase/adenylyltransferase)